ncbi:MAG: hypothetical protein Q9170_004180 [Blastenia crenularia]
MRLLTRLGFATTRTSLASSSPQCYAVLRFHACSSHASFKTGFHALEAKWKANWAAKEEAMVGKKHCGKTYHPFSHLPFSVLGTWKSCEKGSGHSQIGQVRRRNFSFDNPVFDNLFCFSMPKESELFTRLCRDNRQIQTHIQSHGTDLVRACLAMQGHSDGFCCTPNGIAHMENLFRSIWEAISVAHKSYFVTQNASLDLPDIPAGLYESDLDTWMDYRIDMVDYLVHVPPDMPEVPTSSSKVEGTEMWLTGQDALLSMTEPINATNGSRDLNGYLSSLADGLRRHDEANFLDRRIHYHDARILITLIAPFAPSFAEECWVKLHYGQPSPFPFDRTRCGDEGDGSFKGPVLRLEMIDATLVNDKDFRHLPKQGHPGTLPSIFELPWPVPAPPDEIASVQKRVDELRREREMEETEREYVD